MKLNAGSGCPDLKVYGAGWVNVDLSRARDTVCATLERLPFSDQTFEEVRAIHVLEHITRAKHKEVLQELHRVTISGCAIYVEVPDFLAVCRSIVDAADKSETDSRVMEHIRIRTVGVYGKQRYPGDFHHWGFTPYHLERLLHDTGWREVTRETEMISRHYKQEPVLLFKAFRRD